jgi:multidrug resistance protein MdtO
VLTASMLHARKHRAPNFIGIVYVVTVLYSPDDPVHGIEQALWMIPIVGVLTLGLSLIAQWFLWPLSPMDLLQLKLKKSLDTSMGHLQKLQMAMPPEGSEKSLNLVAVEPGQTTELLSLLEQVIRSKEYPRRYVGAWLDLVFDIETLGSNFSELLRRRLKDPSALPLMDEDQRALVHLGIAIAAIKQSLASTTQPRARPPVKDIEDHSLDETRPHQPFLKRAIDATNRIQRGFLILHETSPLLETGGSKIESDEITPKPLQDLLSTGPISINDLKWAMKTTIATMVAFLIVQSLDHSNINTAMVTCVLVADISLGADYRKSLLRFFGALLGGLFGISFIVVIQPLLDTIGGYLIGISPILFLAAWVGSAGPRVATIGVQIGFAFALSVLDQMGPVQDIDVLWFRVLGILLGIIIAGVIDAFLWPERSLSMAKDRLVRVLDALDLSMRRNLVEFNQTSSAYLLKVADNLLIEGRQLLDNAILEPGGHHQDQQKKIEETRAIGRSLTILMKIIQSRHRYYLDPEFLDMADPLKEVMAQLRLAYADEFEQLHIALDRLETPDASGLAAVWGRVDTAAKEVIASGSILPKDVDTILATKDLEERMVKEVLHTRALITHWLHRYHKESEDSTMPLSPDEGSKS